MANQTVITEFILLGFSNNPCIQVFLFFLFLLMYAITLLGNIVIMLVIKTESSLGTPMFYFLSHLAFVDICYSSVTLPKLLRNLITKEKTISWEGCIAQIFFFFQAACAEVFILSAMAYDRYVAVCNPLHYTTTMKKEICRQLVGGAWTMGFLYGVTNALPLTSLHFCMDNKINHYSCDIPSLLVLSCDETITNYIILLSSSFLFGLTSFFFTLVSYIYIIATIMKIRSAEGRSKAFSTCSSHLIVVVLFYGTGYFRYLRPNSSTSSFIDQLFSIQYSISTPMLNPIIYSLKTKEVKEAIKKLVRQRLLTHVK
ncbi:olfactory receptor 5V1-like [Sceloporus undulatus]|uniref:olfactory receptor 5V1-like n=1 Tax=Sceloporus undulatus TaxID=8520 RepID=UPI001C4B124E|nr:olfactory receptor 5V1-like [Sceloporus undulatus]